MLDRTKIDQLRQQLKTGVRTVSAPQLFPTPPDLARRMVHLARLGPEVMGILEPSAGTGRILDEIIAQTLSIDFSYICEIVAVELNFELVDGLRGKCQGGNYDRVRVVQADFLEYEGYFDRIIMNPPFANGADIKHIQHAASLLRPGGRLVALCADGPRQQKAFEDYQSEALPPGTFSDEGTNVNTRIVVIDK
jgi:predicted RNA methylase